MISHPESQESTSAKANPLAPVSYTPLRPYTPTAPVIDRSSRPSNSSLPPLMPTPAPPLARSKTHRDPAALRRLAEQLEYQRSLAQFSQWAEDENEDEDEDEDDAEDTEGSRHSSPSLSREHSYGQQTLVAVQTSSPLTPSRPGPYPFQPQEGRPDAPHPNLNSHPQQTPPQGSMDYGYTAAYSQPHHQHHHQQQQLLLQQSQHQQPQSHAYPYYDNTHPGQNQPSPATSGDSASALYRSSTGSSSLLSSGSQSSASSVPPTPYSSYFGLHNGVIDTPYAWTPPLSTAAQLLIDFNPGLLSTIAVAFRQRMLNNETKTSESANYALEFPVTFTGKEAVDVVIELTTLDNRRHALAIARSLEKQLLFFGGGDVLFDSNNDQYFFSEATLAYLPGKSEFPGVPTGVFPYSTKCYSYGCLPGNASCYSYLCPNKRNLGNVLGRQNSDVSTLGNQEKVWANSVSASVVASVSKKERNRQEAIFEVVNTESNYVRDLELMEEIYITPLRGGEIVDAGKVEALIENTFLNYKEILELNKKLLEAMRTRQQEQPVVESIGDIILSHVMEFEQAYTRYIPRIALSEFTYKREEERNPRFAQFLIECTRHPEARRLGLRHFVGQPYQRVPRYPLLLAEVDKRTEEGHPDRSVVQEVIKMCTELGKRIDACMPEGARQVRLLTIQDKIRWKQQAEHQDLKLNEKTRQLHFECLAKRKAKFDVQMPELRLFVFDHLLVITKEKRDKLKEKDDVVYQISKAPIPLELVNVCAEDGRPMSIGTREQLPGRKNGDNASASRSGQQDSKSLVSVTVEHRGRRGQIFTLYLTQKDRQEFEEKVEAAKKLRDDAVAGRHLFQQTVITQMRLQHQAATQASGLVAVAVASMPFRAMDGKRATCSSPFLNVLDGKRRVVIGTEDGVYVGMEDDPSSFRVAIKDVSAIQVSVFEEYHLVMVLSGKVLKAYDIRCLEPDADKVFQNGQQLGKNVQYYTAGVCAGKTLVITMRRKSANESHFTAYEPIENAVLDSQHNKGFSLSLSKSSKQEWFKMYREFYVGSDSSRLLMLSKMVCVVCPKGFEVLMLENLIETRVYPSRQDPEYSFLLKRPESVPVSMFKLNSDEFLMCYSDFAFTMTSKGTLAKRELIEWEGRPESFAMAYPYIVAFESGLIEVRHIETGALEQLILGHDIRLLHSDGDLHNNATMQVHKVEYTKNVSSCVMGV
ncbi:RHO1 GDP-GTP exchange protein 2 [Mortierella alpina]|nr:RHO1 GDP-GTP exchange protein 2 [Mortierella alpina]